jgi:diadenosine tetraphosphate (Ap4A) HIT family hydrolase
VDTDPAACPFCRLEDERIVASDDLTVTIRDLFPASPGHSLVLPRRHVASFFDATPAERAALMEAVVACRDALVAEYRPDGFNVGFNDGAPAGQTVMHAHVHVIPRYRGDTDNPRAGVRSVLPGRGKRA